MTRRLLSLSIMLISLTFASFAQAQQILAALDRSQKPIPGISQAQLTVILDALRGEARNVLGRQVLVLSETNTLQILRDNDIDPYCVDESCQLSLARCLQAEWLVSTNILPSASTGYLMQLGFYETASGNLLEMREARGEHWEALKNAAQVEARLLYVHAKPEGLRLSSGASPGSGGTPTKDWNFDLRTGHLITFSSEPTGATLYLDGSYVGETALTRELPKGPLRIKLSLPRYEDLEEAIEVSDEAMVHRVLTPLFGWLSLNTRPSGQPVQVDGQAVGVTPLDSLVLGFGSHVLQIGDDSRVVAQAQTIQIEKGRLLKRSLTIVEREGGLSVRAHNAGGNALKLPVLLDGQRVGETPHRQKLVVGEHRLKVGGREESIQVQEREVVDVDWELAGQTRAAHGRLPTSPGPLPGMTFVTIPAGSFQMGSPESEEGHQSDEEPVHEVHVESFQMMTTEVTQAQWRQVMRTNLSEFKGDNRPVVQVSWNDAQEFIRRLNRMDSGKGYRLPAEAEWEYACRAGSVGRWCFGDDEVELGMYAWYEANSDGETHAVGGKKPNTWGLFDMHGNVWEWCQDKWHNGYDGAPVDGSAWEDSGGVRIRRGGSWYSNSSYARCASRSYSNPSLTHAHLGFRCARTP